MSSQNRGRRSVTGIAAPSNESLEDLLKALEPDAQPSGYATPAGHSKISTSELEDLIAGLDDVVVDPRPRPAPAAAAAPKPASGGDDLEDLLKELEGAQGPPPSRPSAPAPAAGVRNSSFGAPPASASSQQQPRHSVGDVDALLDATLNSLESSSPYGGGGGGHHHQ
jgi:hypothetical protein